MENQRVAPFLTFMGNAEEAMNFYEAVLPGAKIVSLIRFEKGQPHGDDGKVLNGVLSFMEQRFMFLDMKVGNSVPPLSWASSFFVQCQDESEFDMIFHELSQDGTVMMGPEAVMDFRKVAWITDKFGITRQPVWK